jgi:hypothetical protein
MKARRKQVSSGETLLGEATDDTSCPSRNILENRCHYETIYTTIRYPYIVYQSPVSTVQRAGHRLTKEKADTNELCIRVNKATRQSEDSQEYKIYEKRNLASVLVGEDTEDDGTE